jgi:hypothetical protein
MQKGELKGAMHIVIASEGYRPQPMPGGEVSRQ